MRTIKFRGRDVNGEFHYGSYCRTVYRDIGAVHTITDEGGEEFNIKPESVAQLVGLDRDGREVYEGDALESDRDNTRFKAAMNHVYTVGMYRLFKKNRGGCEMKFLEGEFGWLINPARVEYFYVDGENRPCAVFGKENEILITRKKFPTKDAAVAWLKKFLENADL